MDMADWNGACFSPVTMFSRTLQRLYNLFRIVSFKYPRSRSSASLSFVALPDHFFCEDDVFPVWLLFVIMMYYALITCQFSNLTIVAASNSPEIGNSFYGPSGTLFFV